MASPDWMSNGGVGVALSTSSASARTSMAPVLSLGFSLPGSLGATTPLMATTYSFRSSRAAACSSAPTSGSKTHWVSP